MIQGDYFLPSFETKMPTFNNRKIDNSQWGFETHFPEKEDLIKRFYNISTVSNGNCPINESRMLPYKETVKLTISVTVKTQISCLKDSCAYFDKHHSI